jgi:hypothetical protein
MTYLTADPLRVGVAEEEYAALSFAFDFAAFLCVLCGEIRDSS